MRTFDCIFIVGILAIIAPSSGEFFSYEDVCDRSCSDPNYRVKEDEECKPGYERIAVIEPKVRHNPSDCCKPSSADVYCGAHGKCVEAKECICKPGYKKTGRGVKKRCESTGCQDDCGEHGTCVDDKCKCQFAWTGDKCDQPKYCAVGFDTDSSKLSEVNVISLDDFSMIEMILNDICQHCYDELNNETLCYELDFEEVGVVICFVSTELACYIDYKTPFTIVKRVGITSAVLTLLVMGTALGAAIYLRHRKKRSESNRRRRDKQKLQSVPNSFDM